MNVDEQSSSHRFVVRGEDLSVSQLFTISVVNNGTELVTTAVSVPMRSSARLVNFFCQRSLIP